MTVNAAGCWATNGHLIADVARLGYIGDDVLDLSYGRGIFWKQHRPQRLTTNDLDPATGADEHHDATLPQPHWYDRFDTVVWDGPYRLNGTPDRGDFDDRFGITQPTSWQDRMTVLSDAAWLAAMYVKHGGTLLVKCQDQVVSGRKVWQTRVLADRVESHVGGQRMRMVDRFDMVRPPRPQPPGRRQVHSRSNTSTLLVFRRAT